MLQTGGPRVSYVIARLERSIRAGIMERLQPYGLTTLQYTALSVLAYRDEPLSNAQLARRSYMTPQSMIKVIEALEQLELIERSPHPNNRRVYQAVITSEGQRVLSACDAEVDEMEREMLSGLSLSEREAMMRHLLVCVRSMHAGFPDPAPAS